MVVEKYLYVVVTAYGEPIAVAMTEFDADIALRNYERCQALRLHFLRLRARRSNPSLGPYPDGSSVHFRHRHHYQSCRSLIARLIVVRQAQTPMAQANCICS